MAIKKLHILRMLWAQLRNPTYLCHINVELAGAGVITDAQCAAMRMAIYQECRRLGHQVIMGYHTPTSSRGIAVRRRFLLRLLFKGA